MGSRGFGADLLLVVRGHSHEAAHVVQLLSGKTVEDALVALATAPEHVVLAAELLGDLHALLHLRGRIGEHVGIRVGGRAVHVDAVAEHVGGAPEELHARLFLLLEHVVGDDIQATVRLLQGVALGNDVAVVEAVVLHAQLGEELKGSVALLLGLHNGIRISGPRALESRTTEHVIALEAEGVPVAHCKAQVLLHGLRFDSGGFGYLSKNNLIGVVPLEGEIIHARAALILNLSDSGEILHFVHKKNDK